MNVSADIIVRAGAAGALCVPVAAVTGGNTVLVAPDAGPGGGRTPCSTPPRRRRARWSWGASDDELCGDPVRPVPGGDGAGARPVTRFRQLQCRDGSGRLSLWTHLIELRDIYKIYPMGEETVHALDGVSLTIDRGEFVAIVGPPARASPPP